MLILSRKKGESIKIGDDIEIFVAEIKGDKVRLGQRKGRRRREKMELLEQMRMLLREKTILFGQYEKETLRLDRDDLEAVDEIVEAVNARQAIIEKINGLDREIEAIRDRSSYGFRCYMIGKNRCDYSGLSEAEQILFKDGQDVFTMITRIRDLEAGVPGKMAKIRAQLQSRIKQNNVNGKFTGYLKQMNQGSKGVLYDKRR